MTTETARIDLRLRRRGMIGYTVGLAAYVFVIVALYPTFKDDHGLNRLTSGDSTVAALFGASGSLTTPPGWLNANLYANFLPLVILLVTIGYGASAIAGQDEDGTLGLVVALPRSRTAIWLQKAATLVLVALPASAATLAVGFIGRQFDVRLDATTLVMTTVAVWLLGIGFGALALLIGALTGSRGTSLSITAVLAAASYLISSLAPVTHWVRPLRFASLFYWAVGNAQLKVGVSAADVAILVVVAVVLVAAGWWAFQRLDVH